MRVPRKLKNTCSRLGRPGVQLTVKRFVEKKTKVRPSWNGGCSALADPKLQVTIHKTLRSETRASQPSDSTKYNIFGKMLIFLSSN